MRGEPRDLRAEPPNCAPAAAHARPSGGAQIRLFCRAAPGVAVPHQAEPWTLPISKCGRARVEPGAPTGVFAAAALAPWPRGVVPGAGHAIRRPSVYTCL